MARVGDWTEIDSPAELAKLEFPEDETDDLRTHIQSIPSPWARLLLFRNAMQDPDHAARALVENDLLDALEVVWASGTAVGLRIEMVNIHLNELDQYSRSTGSARVATFTAALDELRPRRGRQPALSLVRILLVNGRPILGSSPFTALFTAEDAAGDELATYFRYAKGGERRRLADRPIPFQEYITRVILPQITASPFADNPEDAADLTRLLQPWLNTEVQRCRQVAVPAQQQRLVATVDWESAAANLGLERIDPHPIGGLHLFRRSESGEAIASRWRLRATRAVNKPPLVLEPGQFDGSYFEGAARVTLPQNLAPLDRGVVPVTRQVHPWVLPSTDWFSDSVLLLNEPLDLNHVRGLSRYQWRGAGDDPVFVEPRMTLPLRSEFFRYFGPEDVDRMLSIEVHPPSRVTVSLHLEVGPDDAPREIVVQRTYEGASLRRGGPGLTLWPTFRDPRWSDYLLLRVDSSELSAHHLTVTGFADGAEVPDTERIRRTPTVEVTAFGAAPEVLEITGLPPSTGPQAERLGVVLPLYTQPAPPGQTRWDVGIDFGTSNTVVAVRVDGQSAASLLAASNLTLALTHPAQTTKALTDAYFIPNRLESRPFGTAVVQLRNIPTLDMEASRLGLHVSVPFSGYVDGYGERNQVVGDLKWSAEPGAFFRSASFLRHVLGFTIATAIQEGVRPEHLTIAWAYPRAFTPTRCQIQQNQWESVIRMLEHTGLRPDSLRHPPLDESRSVLRHFFNAGIATHASDLEFIVDIGGGTCDIAAYRKSHALILDSVLLGGRDLTGQRLQAVSADRSGNPFVDAFVDWAKQNGLQEPDRKVVEAYLRNGQVHLAFSYLVGTPWFTRGNARSLFPARAEFHSFQALVFYFFGALFYYLGLACRRIPADGGTTVVLPHSVLLAGNGSRYLDWLNNLRPFLGPEAVGFRDALALVLAHGAGVLSPERLPDVHTTSLPKEEVARGLVAPYDPTLREDAPQTGPLIGEAISLVLADGQARRYEPADRLGPNEFIAPARVGELAWDSGDLEIDRFHQALLKAADTVRRQGDQWARLPLRYQEFFRNFNQNDLRPAAQGRIAYLAQADQGFRGSVFLAEANVMIQKMMDTLFET